MPALPEIAIAVERINESALRRRIVNIMINSAVTDTGSFTVDADIQSCINTQISLASHVGAHLFLHLETPPPAGQKDAPSTPFGKVVRVLL
jgi:hypothetical protein